VISMSFEYHNELVTGYDIIDDAIHRVKRGRKDSILFLASAGNLWEQNMGFPAKHADVIPIYAGDSKGDFLWSNPAHTWKGLIKLGTYGTDIPLSIVNEVQSHFPKADFSAGTSIATAIAVGIVAMTLSYVAALPALFNESGYKELFAKLYTKKGMELMLQTMSLTYKYPDHFINPVW